MMKSQQVTLVASMLAIGALPIQRFVGLDGAPCAAGAKALGVAAVDTDADNMAPVNVTGIMLVEAGAAVAAKAEIEVDATARAIALATGKSNGYALDSAAAAGDLIRIVRGI